MARDMRGHGREVARIIWFIIIAHTPWKGANRSTWVNNMTLGLDAGLMWSDPEVQARRAMAVLRASDMVTTHNGRRPKAQRKYGRIITPQIDAPVRILVPPRGAMTNLWITCREARPRVSALVTLMVGMYILAADNLGEHPEGWSTVPGSRAHLRRFVGAPDGSTFRKRLYTLEALELISLRPDCEISLAPPSEWYQTFRAMRKHARDRAA